jgi:hypothetical protein
MSTDMTMDQRRKLIEAAIRRFGVSPPRAGMIGDHEREVEVVPVEEPRFTEPVEAPEKETPAPSEPVKEPEKVPA